MYKIIKINPLSKFLENVIISKKERKPQLYLAVSYFWQQHLPMKELCKKVNDSVTIPIVQHP